jgi:CRISPR-associated protein Cst2
MMLLKELTQDYKDKLATPVYIGIRKGYLQNEEEIASIGEGFVVDSPVNIVTQFNQKYLSNG